MQLQVETPFESDRYQPPAPRQNRRDGSRLAYRHAGANRDLTAGLRVRQRSDVLVGGRKRAVAQQATTGGNWVGLKQRAHDVVPILFRIAASCCENQDRAGNVRAAMRAA
jgi:hypothetical protein